MPDSVSSAVTVELTVNGAPRQAEVGATESAVELIRHRLGLTGTKLVCGGGVCGACTVLVDGTPVVSCLLPATALRGAQLTTVEGLGRDGSLHPVQRAFLADDALQCGYCTPGFVVDAAAFCDRWRADHGADAPAGPDRATIAEALAGHLCRCGAYEGIYRAVAAACVGRHDDPEPVTGRVDGPAKVTGRAVYTTDVRLPGMLHGAIRRSTMAAGQVGPLDLDRPTPGLVAAIELLPPDRRIRWAGQPLVAVAAATSADARRLADRLEIPVESQPFVVDPEAATTDGAPLVHESRAARKRVPNASEGPMLPARWRGNRRLTSRFPYRAGAARRRIARARRDGSPALVELALETVPQLHSSFEPHACVADWSDPDRLRVWVSTQAVDHVAHQLATEMGLQPDQVEVVADHVGGGFGSKLGLTTETVAAARLSREAGRPVRLVLDRHEELTATGNRPGARLEVSMLAGDDGTELRALRLDVESHAGVAAGNVVGALGMLMYGRSPRSASDVDVVTNTPPGTPFRGPGGPITCWAVEQAADQLAHQLQLDPIRLRQHWDGNQRRQALYGWASALPLWQGRPITGTQTGRFRRGVGVAAANWFYFVDPDTEVVVAVEDGRLVASTAAQDMGTGSRTVVARAVAEVFGVPTDLVDVRLGRADASTPHGPTSGGSRTTVSLWSTAQEAAVALREEIGPDLAAAPDGISRRARRGGDRSMRPIPFAVAGVQIGRGFTGAVHVTEVEVDTATGRTRVVSVHGGIAVGRIHVPLAARSQCEGSIVQGIGLALYEQQVLDPHTGLTLTANLEDYRIPQIGDTPEIELHFHTDGWDHVPGEGVGLGEVATMGVAASIGNAVFNATGWRPTSLPIRPDRVVEALG